MNAKQAKRVRRLTEKRNPFILLKLIEDYGDETKKMSPRQIYQATKKLYEREKINLLSLEREMDNANSKS